MSTDELRPIPAALRSYMERMCRSTSGTKIPNYFVEYQGFFPQTRDHIFMLRMPLTDAWERLYVSFQHLAADCIPSAVQAKLDYWVQMRSLLEHARDYAPMNGDLSPITPEEKAIFGVRTNHPNPCFPTKWQKQVARYNNYNEMPAWY